MYCCALLIVPSLVVTTDYVKIMNILVLVQAIVPSSLPIVEMAFAKQTKILFVLIVLSLLVGIRSVNRKKALLFVLVIVSLISIAGMEFAMSMNRQAVA